MTNLIQVLRPQLPSFEDLRPYICRIDNARIYSNNGPLWAEFKSRFEAYLSGQAGVKVHVGFCANGTISIELALRLRLHGRRPGICLMPAYTFVATAHAVVNAGLTPYFLDIDDRALALTPDIVVKELPKLSCKPVAVVVVSAFGAPIDVNAWRLFETEYDIPVVYDAAAAATNLTVIGDQPICLSLHATKTIGIGEGGALVSTDEQMISRSISMSGFAFGGEDRVSQIQSGNYRISEYSSAIGLAVLDRLPDRVHRLSEIAKYYKTALEGSDVSLQHGCGSEWQTMTLNVILPPGCVDAATSKLTMSGIEWRRWWSLGCHTHPAFSSCGRGDLWATKEMASRVIGLPFHTDLSQEDVLSICSHLV